MTTQAVDSTVKIDLPADDWAKINAQLDAAESGDQSTNGNSLNAAPDQAGKPVAATAEKPSSDKTAPNTPKDSGTPTAKPLADAKLNTPEPPKPEPGKPEPKPGDPQPPKSKFAKDQARRDDSWKALNTDKATLATEKASFAAEKAEWQRKRSAELAATPQHSADTYEKYAEKCEAEGKFDLAEEARALAEQVRKNPPPDPIAGSQTRSMEAVKSTMPEMFQKGTPANVLGLELLEKHPQLFDLAPNAPEVMAIMVKERLASGQELQQLKTVRVPELEGEIGRLNSRIKELEQATSPGAGGGSTTLNAKRHEDMTDAEAEADLRALITGAK